MIVRSTILLVACSDLPLGDTPIEGGTPEQVALVRTELEEFDSFVGSGRVSVASIRFSDEADLGGQYLPTSRRILLTDELNPQDVRKYTRHELCHALMEQDHLVRVFGRDVLDELAEVWVEDHWDPLPTAPGARRDEVFAEVCALGALGAKALSEPCEDDVSIVSDVADLLSTDVWAHAPFDEPHLWDPTPTASWTAHQVFLSVSVRGKRVPSDTLWIAAPYVQGNVYLSEVALVDRRTSDELDPDVQTVNERNDHTPPPLDWGLDSPIDERDTLGVDGGPAVGWGNVHGLPDLHPRLAVFDPVEELWHAASPACLPWTVTDGTGEHLFVSGGDVWTTWTEDETIFWAPVTGP